MTAKNPYLRGMDGEEPLELADDAVCLSDHSMTFLMNHKCKDKLPKKIAHVKDICGTTRRLMVKVWVAADNGPMKYWADMITGTLYTDVGACMSSTKREVVKWVRYRKDEWGRRKRVAYGEVPVWNEGI